MRVTRKDKRDRNELEIVSALREIPGLSVETGHDDLLIGYQGKNYWFEVKSPDKVDKNGMPYDKTSKTAKKQRELAENWPGHYRIVSTLDQILEDLGL